MKQEPDWKEMGRKGGRSLRGERKGTAKLTKRDVEMILSSSEPTTALLQRYPISRGHMNAIRQRKWWRDDE